MQALRGPLLTFTGDPFRDGLARAMKYDSDAIVAMARGRIVDVGPARDVLRRLPPGTTIERTGADSLIMAGFIDCHVHYPQTQMIGAFGGQLMDWLTKYTFVAEQDFADPKHARRVAKAFLRETLRNGVTTSGVFGTVHPGSIDAFFAEAAKLGARMICGKALMDRNAPRALRDTARSGYDRSKALIRRWHGRGRLGYAITPRYAGSSSPAQLEAAGALWREFPGCVLQSHVAENREEVAWIRRLFPRARGYLDVYDRFGLLGPGAVYAHGVWLTAAERRRCAETGTAIAHCPTSNAFLGSGDFDLFRAVGGRRPIRVGLATDLGAGTSFSMLRTMGAAIETARRRGRALSAARAFWLATAGSARTLGLADRVGTLAVGMEADLVVLDLAATPLLAFRMRHAADLEEALFALIALADDRTVRETWIAGRRAWRRPDR